MRRIPKREDVPFPAFICERGHRTPYHGGALLVIYCPAHISLRATCGALARVVFDEEEAILRGLR
jgi:hypothetical protein